MPFLSLLKRPDAIAPLLMSLMAFALIIGVLSTVGVTQQADEGAAARIFQLLIALQLPIMALFTIRWLPKYPQTALLVLLLQFAAVFLAVGTILWIETSAIS